MNIRYITYVFPWILLLIILGLRRLSGPRLGLNAALSFGLIGLMLAGGIPYYIEEVRLTSRTRGPGAASAMFPLDRNTNQKKFYRIIDAYRWCGENLPSDAVLLGIQNRTGFYISGLKALSPYRSGAVRGPASYAIRDTALGAEIDSLWRWALASGATHVVIDPPVFYVTSRYLKPGIIKYEHCFTRVHVTEQPTASVYEINGDCLFKTLAADYNGVEDYLAAIGAKQSVPAGNPDSARFTVPVARRILGYLFEVGDIDRAELVFAGANRLFQKNGPLWLKWGAGLNDLGRNTDAVTAFESALSFGADSATCLNNIAVAFGRSGDYAAADSFFAIALCIEPNPLRLKNRIDNLIAAGRPKEALYILDMESQRKNTRESYIETVRKLRKYYVSRLKAN